MRAMGTNVHEACITLFIYYFYPWNVWMLVCNGCGYCTVWNHVGKTLLSTLCQHVGHSLMDQFTELVRLVPVLSLFIHSCLLSLFHWCAVVLCSVCPVVEGLIYMVYVTVYTLHVLCMGSPDLCAGQVMPYLVVMWLA